jgi:hypothetical protein
MPLSVAPEAVAMEPEAREERDRRIRKRNLVLLGVLVGVVALFYLITIVRMSGGAA